MAHKILIVEDETDIRDLIHFHLFKEKYDVLEACDGEEALLKINSEKPDLILLDIMIPKISGLEVCSKVRENKAFDNTKIIFISAKGEEEDIVTGLESGGDDYIAKPFSPKVLMARIKATLRNLSESNHVIEFMGIKVDEVQRVAFNDGLPLNLSVTEFEILTFLISSPGSVYTRGQIVNAVKGNNHAVTDRSVDTQVVSIRKKLKEKGHLIQTVWGVGYRFSIDED